LGGQSRYHRQGLNQGVFPVWLYPRKRVGPDISQHCFGISGPRGLTQNSGSSEQVSPTMGVSQRGLAAPSKISPHGGKFSRWRQGVFKKLLVCWQRGTQGWFNPPRICLCIKPTFCACEEDQFLFLAGGGSHTFLETKKFWVFNTPGEEKNTPRNINGARVCTATTNDSLIAERSPPEETIRPETAA